MYREIKIINPSLRNEFSSQLWIIFWLKYYLKASMSTYRKIKDSSSQKYVQLSNMDNSLGDEKSEGDSNYV